MSSERRKRKKKKENRKYQNIEYTHVETKTSQVKRKVRKSHETLAIEP